MKEFFQTSNSPYSGEDAGLATLWDQLTNALQDMSLDPRTNRKALNSLLTAGASTPAVSIAPHELLFKIQLFTQRANISRQIQHHFGTSPGVGTWRSFEYFLRPLLQEMETVTHLDAASRVMIDRTVWLSESVANLWKALHSYLDAFNVCWLFPKTTNEFHRDSVRRNLFEMRNALSRLSEIRKCDIQFGDKKANQLLPELSQLEGNLVAGAKPNPTQAALLLVKYKSAFDTLRRIYEDFYQKRHDFLQGLEAVFPTRAPEAHAFRLVVDCRDSSGDATRDMATFIQRMASVKREFESSLRDHPTFVCDKEHGDSLRISGDTPEGTLACIGAGVSLAKSENFVRMSIGHDLDSIGISPSHDPQEYNLTQRFIMSMDGDVKKYYDSKTPGFVLAISETALTKIGGADTLKMVIGGTLREGSVQSKGEIPRRNYRHVIIKPKSS